MLKISDILNFLDEEKIPYSFVGDESAAVDGFSSLVNYKSGTFTWVKAQKNIPDGFDCSKISLVFASEEVEEAFPNSIFTTESKHAFFSTIEHFYEEKKTVPAIGQNTFISEEVKLGKDVIIGHNCTLNGKITIDDGTVIGNNVVILNKVNIGKRCVIQSGVVIGHDGFGYTEDSEHVKTMVKHFGGVLIEDDVLISSNCCVCRGTIDDTVIQKGSKIDTLCHIAHNVNIGKNSSCIAGTLLYGSSQLGENSYIASGIIRNQIKVGNDTFVGMGAVVVKDIPDNTTVAGIPAKPIKK